MGHLNPSRKNNLLGNSSGFTLIELIIVVTLTSIIAVMVTGYMANQFAAYVDVDRRTQLTLQADGALRFMSQDLRNAVPNSILALTSGSTSFLIFVPIIEGGRYRVMPSAAGPSSPMFTSPPSPFIGGVPRTVDVYGQFTPNANSRLVIFNTGQPGFDLYEPASGSITPTGTVISGELNQLRVQVPAAYPNPGFLFSKGYDPTSRGAFYLVEYSRAYVCDLSTGELNLYYQNSIPNRNLPVANILASVTSNNKSQLAANVSFCQFSYIPGTLQRSGLVSINLAMTRDGEVVNLLYQTHISNIP